MIIVGVDPGSRRTGYGAIAIEHGRCRLIEKGVVAPSTELPFERKLQQIHGSLTHLLARLRPDALAVEDVFHSANTRTALILSHVRGVVLLAGAEAGLAVSAYAPATVKQEVTGSGRADKHQVAFMVARHLELAHDGEPGDAADALAVALCHANKSRPRGGSR